MLSNNKKWITLSILNVDKKFTRLEVFDIMKKPFISISITPVLDKQGRKTGRTSHAQRYVSIGRDCFLGDWISHENGNSTVLAHFQEDKWNYEDKDAITALENMKKGIPMNVVYDDDGNYWDVFLKSISVL